MKMRKLTEKEYQALLRKNYTKIYNTDSHVERMELYLLITLGTNYQDAWVTKYVDTLKNKTLSTRKQ
ncbi:hypothetical protein [Escherichia coli]|uniref:hypothetical protein n=1 Tax=Escherichia coli TaxID=562 RepID=UPI0021CE8D42|nr:hypothetical protein [Escherichia coli]